MTFFLSGLLSPEPRTLTITATPIKIIVSKIIQLKTTLHGKRDDEVKANEYGCTDLRNYSYS